MDSKMQKEFYTYEDLKSKLEEIFRRYGDKVAVSYVGTNSITKQLTYGDISVILNVLKSKLLSAEVKRAERIAVVAKTTPEAAVINLGLAYLGYTAVLIDATLPVEERNKLLKYADISAVFTSEDAYGQMEPEITKKVPVFEMESNYTFRRFVTSAKICKKEKIEPCYEDVIAIIFSSGTTAEMKGVMVTYNSILYAHKYILQYANLNCKDTFLDVLPSNHIAGYSSSMSCFLTGTEVGFVSEMNAEKLLSGFMNYKPTDFIMIPKVYEVIKSKIEAEIRKKPFLVKCYAKAAMKICGSLRKRTGKNLRFLTKPIWQAALGKNMKLCGCGTLPCSEDVIKFYLDLGIEFVNVYGATETGFPITAADCNEKYPLKGAGNVNQFKEIEIKIFEPDAEGVGEIRVKTPLIMKGYFREPEITRQAFDENGYFKTGDLGYIDAEGYLYITGRIKEAIVLHNGKKVSPVDVDKYYQEIVPKAVVASCGIRTEKGYDNIYLFVERGGLSDSEMDKIIIRLREAAKEAPLYMASQILVIDKIPMTSVGKVKRYLLKKYADSMSQNEKLSYETRNASKITNAEKESILIALVQKFVPNVKVTLDSNLKEELGIDSLTMFELCIEIENALGISIVNRLEVIESVRDVLKTDTKQEYKKKDYSLSDFPQKRKTCDFRIIRRFGYISKLLYRLRSVGIENIPKSENIIFCPNHESYLDAMWVATSLQSEGYEINNFCCLAAEHLKDKKIMKRAFRALGGIPVDREGNTALAMKRAQECLQKEKCCMLIHPEGTRTRSGMLGDFKLGAAKLAIDTGVKIVPVCINGAYEIFSPNVKLPSLYDWKKFHRHSLQISYGTAIDPAGKTEKEIMQIVRTYIVEQKNKDMEK